MSSVLKLNHGESIPCSIEVQVIDKVLEIRSKTKGNDNQIVFHITGKDLKKIVENTSFMAMNILEEEINASEINC